MVTGHLPECFLPDSHLPERSFTRRSFARGVICTSKNKIKYYILYIYVRLGFVRLGYLEMNTIYFWSNIPITTNLRKYDINITHVLRTNLTSRANDRRANDLEAIIIAPKTFGQFIFII